MVEYLPDRGAIVDDKTYFKDTALHYAAVNGHLEVARYLVDRVCIWHHYTIA